ncbi:hypothetical protein BS50DRAFT_128804 [Corynespora cassiicola Philippines]|uniref:Uncharacterized protein n=1 Tax=Corynespora cassiicola Philippines TaxID=1448308 RepID=A0A2T2NBM7_CORCC|nr:hypothetical protein BS50DRAFT_128804 [Corynespora cassiicola Philippines]
MSSENTATPQERQKEDSQKQPWKKWLVQEMNSTVEGDSKKPWSTWKPNPNNPAEKPWLIWNSGAPGEAAGLRDDRPHNAASFSFSLKDK